MNTISTSEGSAHLRAPPRHLRRQERDGAQGEAAPQAAPQAARGFRARGGGLAGARDCAAGAPGRDPGGPHRGAQGRPIFANEFSSSLESFVGPAVTIEDSAVFPIEDSAVF